MNPYTLFIQYSQWKCTAKKELKNDKDAIKWAQLCLDICGKDEQGNNYVYAILSSEFGGTIKEFNPKAGPSGLKLSNPWMKLYIQSDDKKFLVRKMTASLDEANAFCANEKDCAVIAFDQISGLHVIADINETDV